VKILALQCYDSWRKVSSTPSEYWKESLQALANNTFENASTLAKIQEEKTFGNLDWSDDLQVRITHIISDKNTGEKLGDDFRNVIFPDMTHKCVLGQRYSFDNNYWIIVNTDKFKYPTISACIRRVNNVLNNYDKYGVLHSEPCIIDYQIRSTDFDFNNNIIVPDGYTTILVQGNEWTKMYHLNQRFMFGGQAWKCTFINNFQRINTLDNSSVNLIRMILMKDAIAPDDDVINNIPNTKTYNYTISIDQGNILEQQVNYTSTLSATVKNGTEIVNGMELLWESNDNNICEIQQNGSFILKSEGTCNVTVSLKDNSSVSALLIINVVALPVDNYEIRISPNISEILQGDFQTFDVALYHNNIRQNDIITSIPSGVPSSYYKFTSASNGFTITNLKQYTSSPLVVVCSGGGYSKNISINLSGGW
jgi:hypothetical protein